jgi:hypothetical protein
MFGLRFVGLFFFWSGFLLASIAMVMQREIDLLPPAEREGLFDLDDQMVVPPAVVARLATGPVQEMDQAEFLATMARLRTWWEDQATGPDTDPPGRPASEQLAPTPPPPQDAGPTNPVLPPADAEPVDEPLPDPLTKATLIKIRTERVANLWPTIAWTPYLGAVVLGLVGVVMLRLSKQRATADGARQQAGLDQLNRSLSQILVQVQGLADALPEMTPEAVVGWIDERCMAPCQDFADQRNVLKDRFGLAAFGEIMSEFASGERFLNRVWSAAADGYMEEAYRSVKTSLAFFQAAERRLRDALGGG